VTKKIEKSENALDDAEKRMFKIRDDSIEKISMLRKLALKSGTVPNKFIYTSPDTDLIKY
jgi:hypothetical protein